MAHLDDVRKQLSEYDDQIVDLLAQRMSLIPEVVQYKKTNGVARYQPEREQQVIQRGRERAESLGMNPDLAEEVMKSLIKYAHLIEKQELD